MPNENEVREELVGLLRYANATAIAEQLGVSPQAVINWSKGKHPSERRLNAIKRLYGLPVASQGTKKDGLPSEDDRPLMISDVVGVIDALARSGYLDATARALLDAVLAGLGRPPRVVQAPGTPRN